MRLTAYHAKYYAYELTRRCPSGGEDRLAGALVDAQVDLKPHQIDASLFAFWSPLFRGVVLADEVGLGKTIEAGLVLAQKGAERKRRMLVIINKTYNAVMLAEAVCKLEGFKYEPSGTVYWQDGRTTERDFT